MEPAVALDPDWVGAGHTCTLAPRLSCTGHQAVAGLAVIYPSVNQTLFFSDYLSV